MRDVIESLKVSRNRVLNAVKWLLLCGGLAVAIGTASAGFLISLDWVTGYRENNIELIGLLPIGGLLTGLLYHYWGKEVVAGNNLLIDRIEASGPRIPFRMAPMIYLGTMVTHLLGGSAGREGTALQMAGGIADQFAKPFRLSFLERSIVLKAAVAAGFGAVFGTPLAGIIFALEFSKIGKVQYKGIVPIGLTAILADLVTQWWNASHTHYSITEVPRITLEYLLYACLVGIVFGICSRCFSIWGMWLSTINKQYIHYAPLRPFIGGVIVALGVWILGTTQYIGLGIPTIVSAFEQPQPFYVFAFKIVFTLVTLSSGFKGGEVTPLFFIGATLGSALSFVVPLPVGLLAGMGFVAVFAGATNTPIACTLMGIELFGGEGAVYIALACMMAYIASGHTGIYGRQLIGVAKVTDNKDDEGKRLEDVYNTIK